MNLSGVCKVNVGPTGGETFTVTCFACGMPSSKEWAQRVRSRPLQGNQQEPFFPILGDMSPPLCGAVVMEDGSVYLCAFCHALLEAQWNNYEAKRDSVSVTDRKYNVHKFVCAVCAVETYRKRVRALPFQEFPFLVKQRQPDSITLGNNPLAVVCLDCSETLWAQSAEYDRWGLPIHKRHFNWMARPPPPEDSVEATVARLPSGETQLPRCPPTDPLVPPKTNEPTALPEAIPPIKSNKYKISGGHKHDTFGHSSVAHSYSALRHHHHHQQEAAIHTPHQVQSGRKSSVGSTSSPTALDIGGPHTPQPPVVTVAPMSTQHTLTNVRKDSMSSYQPNNPSTSHPKYDGMTVTQGGPPPSTHGGALSHHASQLFHQTPLFSPSGSYPGPFSWPSSLSREGHSAGELPNHPTFGHYGGSPLSDTLPNPPTWPWLPPASPELLRYQSYISSLQNRRLSEAYYASPGALYPPTSSATYLPPLQLHRTPSPPTHNLLAQPSSSPTTTQNLLTVQRSSLQEVEHSIQGPDYRQVEYSQRGNYAETPKSSSRAHSSKSSKLLSHDEPTSQGERINLKLDSPKRDSSPERSQSKAKKHLAISSERSSPRRKSSFSKSEPSSSSSKDRVKRLDVLLPKKRHWQPPSNDNQDNCKTDESRKSAADRKRKCSLNVLTEKSEIQDPKPMDFAVRRKRFDSNESSSTSSVTVTGDEGNVNKDSAMDAMDLTISSSTPRARTSSCPPSTKFSIAFLSKSESFSPPPCDQGSPTGRSSVIVSIPNKDKTAELDYETTEPSEDSEIYAGPSTSQIKTCTTEETEGAIPEGDKKIEQKDQSDINEDIGDEPDEVEPIQGVTENKVTNEKEETQIHMLTIGDLRIEPQDYVRKTIENYVSEGKQIEITRKEKLNKQLDFLSNLGLITPEKKLEIEIEMLAGRSEKYTLPPIRMRVKSPTLSKLDEVLEQQLLEVAFNDPSLRQGTPEPEKSGFLHNLGLKPCSKKEKSRREVEWRLVLTERLMREKRDEKLRGVKRTWDTYDKVSKLLCLPTRSGRMDSNTECLSSLTLTLPPETETNATGPRRNSSDLLTTVEASLTLSPLNSPVKLPMATSDVPKTTVMIKNGVCINYPKYIPSYVLTAQSKEEAPSENVVGQSVEEEKALEILNPSLGQIGWVPTTSGSEPILRIPVVSSFTALASARRRSSCSTIRTMTDDSDADLTLTEDAGVKEESLFGEHFPSLENPSKKALLPQSNEVPDWSEVDVILKASTAEWEKTKKVMEKVLSQTSYLNSKENKQLLLEERVQHFTTIRKHLKLQQADMRLSEKLFKAKQKQILKKLTKYSNSKEAPSNSSL